MEALAASFLLSGAACLFSPPFSQDALPISSSQFFWRPSSWQVSSSRLFSEPVCGPLSFLLQASGHRLLHHSGRTESAWAWVREAGERRWIPARRFPESECQIPLPPPLLRNLLRATRYKRRCRRILLLHHVRRAWDRRTSLLLLISVRPGMDRVPAAGTKNLKDHRKLLLERRAIIARRS